LIFKGQKVILRPVELSDLKQLLNINDPEVRQNLLSVFPLNQVREEEWVKGLYSSQKDVVFGVVPMGEEKLIGTTGLHGIDWVNRVAEFGIAITDKNYWNMGLGTEATQLTLKYAFEFLNLNRVSLRVYEYNKRAIHVYEKCGFVHEGRLRKARYLNGKYHDVLIMSVLSDEYFRR